MEKTAFKLKTPEELDFVRWGSGGGDQRGHGRGGGLLANTSALGGHGGETGGAVRQPASQEAPFPFPEP